MKVTHDSYPGSYTVVVISLHSLIKNMWYVSVTQGKPKSRQTLGQDAKAGAGSKGGR